MTQSGEVVYHNVCTVLTIDKHTDSTPVACYILISSNNSKHVSRSLRDFAGSDDITRYLLMHINPGSHETGDTAKP